ncbi:hypothetical protein PtA15_6A31 [Puccinia triticina]|uniref:Uncharacterized protein n=1 Tax=Puccinia triticina TaxID=208348 RepID=A0ABY7CJJ6_9BASI|nr:uncharacterized protein PtA15_6A31 [Puccinia triticina]WAQ85403.1 hypothetical protein PtA15_6A31 [Puccinia triticina]
MAKISSSLPPVGESFNHLGLASISSPTAALILAATASSTSSIILLRLCSINGWVSSTAKLARYFRLRVITADELRRSTSPRSSRTFPRRRLILSSRSMARARPAWTLIRRSMMMLCTQSRAWIELAQLHALSLRNVIT